jgi:TolB protein
MRIAVLFSRGRPVAAATAVATLAVLTVPLGACGDPTGTARSPVRLAFVRAPFYDTLFVANPENGVVEQRIALPVRAVRVRLSPSGDRLAMVSGGVLWVMSSDVSGARQIVSNVLNIAWSPDGKRLAYVRGSPQELHLIDVDGSNDTVIPGAVPGGFEGLAWSPDGGRIAFEGIRQMEIGATRTVYIVNLDGTGLRDIDLPLSGPDARASGEPTWSPDGQQLAFHRYFRYGDGAVEMKLWVVTLAAGTARRITSGDGDDVRATWSPYGDQITFLRYNGSTADVFVVRPDGTGLRQITNTPDREEQPQYWLR